MKVVTVYGEYALRDAGKLGFEPRYQTEERWQSGLMQQS